MKLTKKNKKIKKFKKYISPQIKVENISAKLFKRRSFMEEIGEFNLLAAMEDPLSDDY